jgi:methionine-rich copper-binding protein CopC
MTRQKWLGAALLVALSPLAQAHTHLKEAVPADNSTVKSPESIALTFSETARLTALSIQKDGGKEQKLAPLPSAAAARLTVPAPKLAAGKYTLSYRVVSSDSHVTSGKIHFTVTEGGAT